ncbi:hypothetical protein ACFFMN_20285 [Planobispora siamensis]|uniref:hypothetical protein n=1 Tax=Planobispora siamensis TaxID=936338 RepID=UPI0019516419|nr:hypothetical protein [Planobispora siamensis]
MSGTAGRKAARTGLRKIADLGPGVRDVVFTDDGHLLVLDAEARLWRAGLTSGSSEPSGDFPEPSGGFPKSPGEPSGRFSELPGGGDAIGIAVRRAFPWAGPHLDVVPRQVSWHRGPAATVVRADCGGHWCLAGRTGAGSWLPLLTGSATVSDPDPSWSPDGTRLAVGVDGVRVVDLPWTGRRTGPWADYEAEVWGWTPSGRLLLYHFDGDRWSLSVVSPARGTRPRALGAPYADFEEWGWPVGLAVAGGGGTCVVAFRRALVRYALPSLEVVGVVPADGFVGQLTPSTGRRHAATESEDGVQVWDLATGVPLTEPLTGFQSARLSPSGRFLACRAVAPADPSSSAEPGWSIWRPG